MESLKKLLSKIVLIHFVIVLSYLLIGCGSTTTIYVTEVDTVVIRDTIQLAGDSIWYGGITNGSDTIGSLAVFPKSKKAIVDIKWLKPDSVEVKITDTKYIYLSKTVTDIMSALFTAMPFYQKLLILILLAIALFVIYKLWSKK